MPNLMELVLGGNVTHDWSAPFETTFATQTEADIIQPISTSLITFYLGDVFLSHASDTTEFLKYVLLKTPSLVEFACSEEHFTGLLEFLKANSAQGGDRFKGMLFNEAEPIVDFQLATNVDLMNFTQNCHFARSIQIELTHSVELSTFLEKALELVKTGEHNWDEVSTLKLRLFPRITGSDMELGRRAKPIKEPTLWNIVSGYGSLLVRGFVTIQEDYIRIAIVNATGVCIEMVQRGVWVITVIPGGVVIFNEIFTGFRTLAVLVARVSLPIANEWVSGFEDLLRAAEYFGVRLTIERMDEENHEESE
ncbi:hypothetical protein COEREDRAFT_5581 [Coemansia reversa NRRL 1564]|uniref:Uncharacterized protein n=1 Tax=Coemansia reversa (strain ATCC 12441 / NRRL 1564) TaxID=763665 RepID=A0A2G5BL94_COERN|nr:hypothetical protein COEREDRAFT_5581 [Coemansia reversa NRRL 1564]|eukprot:PIA19776.1 hypothetical protein COEREDRAFT_5581 [Coemansia reversa NRRL 1564]